MGDATSRLRDDLPDNAWTRLNVEGQERPEPEVIEHVKRAQVAKHRESTLEGRDQKTAHKRTLQELYFERMNEQAEMLVAKAIELASAGSETMLRDALDRTLGKPAPRRELEDPLARAADLASQLTPEQRRAMLRLVDERLASSPPPADTGTEG